VVFQQDGASVHTAKTTMEWLRVHKVDMLNEGIWPSMSPDLNPVEHVWPYVSRQLRDHIFNTRDELWAALENAFGQIPPTEIKKLYDSMQRRLTAVIVAHGAHTKY
jgi:hypothetical protein